VESAPNQLAEGSQVTAGATDVDGRRRRRCEQAQLPLVGPLACRGAKLACVPDSGIFCLANDPVVDALIALCASVRHHDPDLPLTVIPFNDNIARTRRALTEFGYGLLDDSSLATMDAVGSLYWPDDPNLAHNMRKFCSFCGPYERFLFLDSDIVVLHSLEPYFESFRRSDADFMWFSPDLNAVYRPGPVRDAMVSRYNTAAFNGGQFMGRRGAFTPSILTEVVEASRQHRHGFVDFLEQSFMNYAVDTRGLSKIAGHEAVPGLAVAGAMLRLRKLPSYFVIDDPRAPESGRRVSLIHWAGYRVAPFMPYRRTWLAYRLAGVSRAGRWEYHGTTAVAMVKRLSWRTPVRLVRRGRVRTRNRLASRGYIGWPSQ
jgi:hypothetical protein